jgi:UDP-2,3-diacylglucosamine pyrophosphatase LpxH
VKLKVKNAVKFIDDFETAVAEEAKRRGVDGVICGHIHHAEMREIGGVLYVNDGDWVESCTAVIEHHGGALEVVEWAKVRGWSMLERDARTPQEPMPTPVPAFA